MMAWASTACAHGGGTFRVSVPPCVSVGVGRRLTVRQHDFQLRMHEKCCWSLGEWSGRNDGLCDPLRDTRPRLRLGFTLDCPAL